jgi:hypothetical protein
MNQQVTRTPEQQAALDAATQKSPHASAAAKTTATTKFTIETGVAIPARQSFPRGARGSMYPLETMKEGQSFAIPVKDKKEADQKRSYLSSLAKSRDTKAVTRYFPDEGVVRCWHGGPRAVEAAAEAK